MKRSHAVAALALVASLCVALPAVGAAPNPLKVAKKALNIGKQANKRARTAKRTADRALKTGRAADARAGQALRTLAGSVPNATRAQSAGVADALEGMEILRFNTRVAPSATATPQAAARTAAQRVPLIAEGPITIYGKCFVDSTTPGNPLVSAEIFVETSVGGVIYSADDGSSNNGFLDPGAAETDADLLSVASAAGIGNPGTLNASDADAGNFYVIAPGLSIQGQLTAATKVGSPTVGDGVFGPGNACIFAGLANAG
jgi:hypothetical protein